MAETSVRIPLKTRQKIRDLQQALRAEQLGGEKPPEQQGIKPSGKKYVAGLAFIPDTQEMDVSVLCTMEREFVTEYLELMDFGAKLNVFSLSSLLVSHYVLNVLPPLDQIPMPALLNEFVAYSQKLVKLDPNNKGNITARNLCSFFIEKAQKPEKVQA